MPGLLINNTGRRRGVGWEMADGIAGQFSPFSGERMGSICLDGLTHATVVKETLYSRQGCRDVFTWRQRTLTYIALGLVQVGVSCLKNVPSVGKARAAP